MDAQEQKALQDIQTYGCHILHVMGEGELPPFSYTIGIHKSQLAPELIVIGLKQPLAHSILNEYNRLVRDGSQFRDGQIVEGFVEGFGCVMKAVDERYFAEYFGWARWLYSGNHFKAMQLVYPSTSGAWPWDAQASDWFRSWQPILGVANQ